MGLIFIELSNNPVVKPYANFTVFERLPKSKPNPFALLMNNPSKTTVMIL
jgi:hypothetical protein